MRADLHVHSTASDGTLPPAELVDLALSATLDVLAITDHDSVAGLPEAFAAAEGTDLKLVPAVELSSVLDGRDIHVLGYWVDWRDTAFLRHLADMRAARLRRAESMVDALSADGLVVELEHVLTMADGGAIGRTHLARALVERGHASSVADAFERLIGRGRPYYVPKDARSPQDALAIILASGGLPVLAHPAVNGVEDVIPGLVAAGLRGIEVYHADHAPDDKARLAETARELGLLATGGTDFHGPNAPNPPLGSVAIPPAAIEALLSSGDF